MLDTIKQRIVSLEKEVTANRDYWHRNYNFNRHESPAACTSEG
jgi:hypothetical protein